MPVVFINIDLRDQVHKKIDKILEPPPVKAAKPLPRPDDAPRKKRGGRRYRMSTLSWKVVCPFSVVTPTIA